MAGKGKEIYSQAGQTVVGRVYVFFLPLLPGHLLCVVCNVIPKIYHCGCILLFTRYALGYALAPAHFRVHQQAAANI